MDTNEHEKFNLDNSVRCAYMSPQELLGDKMKIGRIILILFLMISCQKARTAGSSQDVVNFTIEVANNYVTNSSPALHLNVMAGIPSFYSVQVDNANFSTATNWTAYSSSNITANLGSIEGWHEIWVGLKDSQPKAKVTWKWKRLKLDWTPPMIVVTNPTVSTVSVPMIQIYGYCPKALAHISCDISNAAGVVKDQDAGVTGQFYSTSTWELTTNYFECLDVPLTNGLNTITIHATDLAGNSTITNFSFTLNYSGVTNPMIKLTWPQDGMDICGNSFTLRGQVEDASSTVTASVTDTSGNTSTINGEVERNGILWVDNLPLRDGTNKLTLTVKNSAGLSSVTNICVTRSSFVLTMDKVKDDLWLPKVNVTGFENDATYAVWVNGVKATVLVNADGTGKWMAHNVPVTPGGVASFDMHAYASDEKQPDGSYANGSVAIAGKNTVASLANSNDVAATNNPARQEMPLITIPVQPVFLKMSQSSGTLYFTWSTISNSTYQLQYTVDLNSTNWFNLGGRITATSNSISATDILGKDTHRFYRVQLVQ